MIVLTDRAYASWFDPLSFKSSSSSPTFCILKDIGFFFGQSLLKGPSALQ